MARHRIGGNLIGFGNPEPAELDNNGKIDKIFAAAAIETYFQKTDGFDFSVKKDSIAIGIEPSYQYDDMLIITIAKDKKQSNIVRGRAWGPYGSGVTRNVKVYKDYKLNSKFKRFVDQWHPVLFKKGKQ